MKKKQYVNKEKKDKFCFATSLEILRNTKSVTSLKELLEALETDVIMLDAQLIGYEEGIDTRTPLWYKQAQYVFKCKEYLINVIKLKLADANPFQEFIHFFDKHNVPYGVTKLGNGHTKISIFYPEYKASFEFDAAGSLDKVQ